MSKDILLAMPCSCLVSHLWLNASETTKFALLSYINEFWMNRMALAAKAVFVDFNL